MALNDFPQVEITPVQALSTYLRKNKITNFDEFDFMDKLALVQQIPKDKVKKKKVGKKKNEMGEWEDNYISYLPHEYAQKVLNFVFNFRISNRILSSEYYEYFEKKDKYQYNPTTRKREKSGTEDVKVVEAEVIVEFTFVHPDGGHDIVRTVVASHKQYTNEAVTRGMAKSAALSKAWTTVLATFGPGKNLDEQIYSRPSKEQDSPVVTKPGIVNF